MSRDWMSVLIFEPARSEILHWPLEIKKDLGSILTKIQKGETVGHPDTKPMTEVASGVFEIRLKDASGAFRAFYVIRSKFGILVFHSFKKKTRKTPKQEIETGKKRLKSFLKELEDEK